MLDIILQAGSQVAAIGSLQAVTRRGLGNLLKVGRSPFPCSNLSRSGGIVVAPRRGVPRGPDGGRENERVPQPSAFYFSSPLLLLYVRVERARGIRSIGITSQTTAPRALRDIARLGSL